jgi:hypothetical protein
VAKAVSSYFEMYKSTSRVFADFFQKPVFCRLIDPVAVAYHAHTQLPVPSRAILPTKVAEADEDPELTGLLTPLRGTHERHNRTILPGQSTENLRDFSCAFFHANYSQELPLYSILPQSRRIWRVISTHWQIQATPSDAGPTSGRSALTRDCGRCLSSCVCKFTKPGRIS